MFRIARRVAKDRVISTVDPDTRHGHKSVTPGNAGDASVATDLIADLLPDTADPAEPGPAGPAPAESEMAESEMAESEMAESEMAESEMAESEMAESEMAESEMAESEMAESEMAAAQDPTESPAVYGDNAYGTGEFHTRLGQAGISSRCKTQAPTAAGGLFSKDRFDIDLDAQTVTCPAGNTAAIRAAKTGGGSAYFGAVCAQCPLRAQCSTAAGGRSVSVGAHEQALADARARQNDPAWLADYRSTRPKVERKLGHLMRRRHGGRRARVRGTAWSQPCAAA